MQWCHCPSGVVIQSDCLRWWCSMLSKRLNTIMSVLVQNMWDVWKCVCMFVYVVHISERRRLGRLHSSVLRSSTWMLMMSSSLEACRARPSFCGWPNKCREESRDKACLHLSHIAICVLDSESMPTYVCIHKLTFAQWLTHAEEIILLACAQLHVHMCVFVHRLFQMPVCI